MLFRTIVFTLLLCACTPVSSPPTERENANDMRTVQRTVIWVGDSLDSFASEGDAADVAPHLLAQEWDVAIKNLSAPGATLSLSGPLGYNSDWTTDSFAHLCGLFTYCHGVVITAGVNDFTTPGASLDGVERSLDRMLSWAQQRDIKVLMGDLIWATRPESGPSETLGVTFADYRARRAAVCARYSVCRFAARPAEFDHEDLDLFAARERANGQVTHLNVAGQRERANWLGEAGAGWVW